MIPFEIAKYAIGCPDTYKQINGGFVKNSVVELKSYNKLRKPYINNKSTNMKKIILFTITISFIMIILSGCDLFYEEIPMYEDWLCTVNTEGTDLNYLRESMFRHFVVTPDSERVILFSTGHIYSMNIDSSDFLLLNDSLGSYCSSIAETPDGTKIVFSHFLHNSDIYELDLESSEIKNLTNTPDINEYEPYYSHNGTKITYITTHDTVATISTMDYNGDNKSIVYEYGNQELNYRPFHCPCFSINDDKIFYVCVGKISEINHGLYSINIDGSDKQYIFDYYVGNFPVSMPADGSKIVFCSFDSLYIMNEDGSDLTNLGEADLYRPVISRDGSEILFEYGIRLFIMNIDGSGRRKLIDDLLNDYCKTVAFLPDDKVLCSVERRIQ